MNDKLLKFSFILILFLLAFTTIDSNINTRSEKVAISQVQKNCPIIDGMVNFKKWKGTFHYKLNYSDDIFDSPVSFLKMKGLRGEQEEQIILDGNIIFTPKVGNSLYVGSGVVKYDVTIMNYSALGESMIIHYTDGKGSAKIIPNKNRTYMRIDYYNKKYSLRIDPGVYEEDLDAIGLPVEVSSRNGITKAMFKKFEEEGRPILYPDIINDLFPNMTKGEDCLNVVVEAFNISFSPFSNSLKGSYTDEKGGILTWKFHAF